MKFIELSNGDKKIFVRFRRFKPDDAESLVKCIREEYGDFYFKPKFYDTEYLKMENASGHIIFLVAERDNGEVVGILALNPKVRLCEIATGIVQKKYRGFKIIRFLFDMAVDEIRKMEHIYAGYCRTVMYHNITQKLMEKINFEPCGFLMSEFFTDDLCNDDFNLKQPHGILIKNISRAKTDKIYICSEHNKFFQEIYKSLQVEIEIDNHIYDFTDKSQIYYENDESQKSCSIFVNVPGKDITDKINEIQSKYIHPMQTFNVLLNINHKSANMAYEKLKSAGYFFSGVRAICAENEFMIMHNPKNIEINFNKFAVTDKFSKVTDYVKKFYDRRLAR